MGSKREEAGRASAGKPGAATASRPFVVTRVISSRLTPPFVLATRCVILSCTSSPQLDSTILSMKTIVRILILAAAALAAFAVPVQAQTSACVDGGARCITVSFRETEMHEVAAVFAEFSGTSVVLAPQVSGKVTAEVHNQPWDVAFAAILQAHGYAARQIAPGLLRVDDLETVARNAVQAPLVTRVFRISYVPAADVARALEGVVSERGSIAVSAATNALVVTDTEDVIATMARVIGHPPM